MSLDCGRVGNRMVSSEQFRNVNMPHPCLYAPVVVISVEVSVNCGSFEC